MKSSTETQGLLAGTMRYFRAGDIFGRKFTLSAEEPLETYSYLTSSRSGRILQRIQNIAARLISGTRSTDHITPILKNLHWLPVEARINFKILLITYKILNGQSTSYLEPIIQESHPSLIQ